jgi:hypothetical protein
MDNNQVKDVLDRLAQVDSPETNEAYDLICEIADENNTMWAVLKDVEWGSVDYQGRDCCPMCQEHQRVGHAFDCLLGKVLK